MKRHAKAIVALSALLLTLCVGVTLAGAAAPLVTMGSVSDVSYTSAHVSGEVDPQDNDTYYYFQYTANPEEGWSFEGFEGPLAAGSGPTTVERDLTGLKPGTQYFVRLAAANFVDAEVISAEPYASFTTDPVGAPSISIDPPSAVTGTGAHFSGTIDPEAPSGNPAAYDVNWRFECTPECPGLSGTIPGDDEPHTVESNATGLTPSTDYEVTLVAENAAGPVSAGPESFTTSVDPPSIQGLKVDRLYTEAELIAKVNPGGAETTYHFEYGPTSSYGESTAEQTLPAGASDVSVSAFAQSLQPGTGYHFRLVAINSAGTTESPDVVFSTRSHEAAGEDTCPNAAVRVQQSSTRLPECRAYEQVSPVDKHSSDVMGFNAMSADGEAVSWFGLGAYADPQGPGNAVLPYVARRSGGSWQVTNMAPRIAASRPGAISLLGAYSFSDDLSTLAIITSASYDSADQDLFFGFLPQLDVYRVRSDRQAELRSHNISGPLTNEPVEARLVGTSADGSTEFFLTSEKLDPSAPDGVQSLYRNHNGQVDLVSRDEIGVPLAAGGRLGVGREGPYPSTGEVGMLTDSDAVSPDGESFVYISEGQVYLRSANGEVRIISRSQRTGDDGAAAPHGARFAGANDTLTKILIGSKDPLTDDAPPYEDFEGSFYLYDTSQDELTYIGKDSTVREGNASNGVVKISPNADRIYFVEAKFVPDTVEIVESRLFVWSPEGTREIGEVDKADGLAAGGIRTPNRTAAYLSHSGNRLVFQSRGDAAGIGSSGRSQVYLYDYGKDATVCLSCGSPTSMGGSYVAIQGVGELGTNQPRVISADGSRVIFTSGDQLLPQDSNSVNDAYQWTMGGYGGCTPASGSFEPASGGCLYLLSAGDSPYPSRTLAISPDGANVFIQTRSKLAPSDTDNGLSDIYSVRVNGGSLVPQHAACIGDACQVGSTPPERTQIGSALIQREGKPKARHKSRCQRKKARGSKRRGKARCGKRTHNGGRAK